jgi:hypothetical protein
VATDTDTTIRILVQPWQILPDDAAQSGIDVPASLAAYCALVAQQVEDITGLPCECRVSQDAPRIVAPLEYRALVGVLMDYTFDRLGERWIVFHDEVA